MSNSLTDTEKTDLLKDFPNVELSYETIVHKKVYNADIILAIPEGKKHFVWFTTFRSQNVCLFLEINQNKRISNIFIVSACFHSELSFGSIFYGTFFKHNNFPFFSFEDVFYYKGKNVSHHNYSDKLSLFSDIFQRDIKQIAYNKNNVVFGLPLIFNNYNDILNAIEMVPYKISFIQFRYLKRNNGGDILNLVYNKQGRDTPIHHPKTNNGGQVKREIVFKITPEIQNDIYNLSCYDNNGRMVFYDIAYIPDYKTSVSMNKLFRNIKENQNLDALEESDDEEEFQDDRIDKFVFLEKEYNMVCTFNYKYKKWVPIRVARNNEKIISKQELQLLEKNKY
jgi:hypothetical protein